MISTGFVGHDAVAAMTLLILTVSLGSFLFCGFNINHLDLAPNFAGVLMGIANGLENITTIMAPLTVGWVVHDPVSLLSIFLLRCNLKNVRARIYSPMF